jgi:hypothetical protein
MYPVLAERSFVSCSLMMWSWLMLCSTTADLSGCASLMCIMTFLMAQANFEPTFSCIYTLTILKPSYYFSSYPPAHEDGTDRVFRNVGIQNSDAGELPRRK